jgi:glycosyltransferase involved in cell wall biosynthesis
MTTDTTNVVVSVDRDDTLGDFPQAVRVALIGVDTSGAAPGGMATISRALVEGFKADPLIDMFHISNFDEGSVLRRLKLGLGAAWLTFRRRHEIDVVHLQVSTGLSVQRELIIALVARTTGKGIVTQFHGSGQIEDFKQGSTFHRLCYRLLLHLAHNLVLGSNAADWITSVNSSARVTVVPNGIPVPSSFEDLPVGSPTIVFVGRLGKRKGIFDLLEALERLHARGLGLRLLLLGDGDTDAVHDYLHRAEHLEDSVAVCGWQDEETVRKAIVSAMVLVLPSYAEGLPMAILEALALGRPVIATRVGEIEDVIIDGYNGLLVDSGDIDALSEAIRRITTDPKLAAALGKNGHQFAQKALSTEQMLSSLTDIYVSAARRQP